MHIRWMPNFQNDIQEIAKNAYVQFIQSREDIVTLNAGSTGATYRG